MLRDYLHLLFHQILECFIILTLLVLDFHACLILVAKLSTVCSSNLQFPRFVMSSDLKTLMTSLMNFSSCSLFFGKESLVFIMCSSSMAIVIVREAWSEVSHQEGWIACWLSLLELLWRNIRSNTKSDTPSISEYLVGIGLVETDKSKLNKSAIINRSSLIVEWWEKEGSYRLSLMLKSPVIIIKLSILTSVSVMRRSGHGQFLFYFLLFSDFIGILFFFSFLFRDNKEARDIAVTWHVTWCDVISLEHSRKI